MVRWAGHLGQGDQPVIGDAHETQVNIRSIGCAGDHTLERLAQAIGFAAFDRVDLGQLRKFAKRNRAVRVRAGLCSLLFGFPSAEMDRPQKPAEPVTKVRGRQTARMAA